MLNRYTLNRKWKQEGLEAVLADTLIPPTKWATEPLNDVWKMLTEGEPSYKTLQSLPYGRVLYSRINPESKAYDMLRLSREINASYAEGKSYSSIRGKLNKYNAWARQQEDKKPITLSTLTKAKQRARKAELNKKREK